MTTARKQRKPRTKFEKCVALLDVPKSEAEEVREREKAGAQHGRDR